MFLSSNYFMAKYKENTAFGRIHRDLTRGNRQKLQGKFQLEIQSIFVIMKRIKY